MQGNCSLLGIVLYFCLVWGFFFLGFFPLELRGVYVFNFFFNFILALLCQYQCRICSSLDFDAYTGSPYKMIQTYQAGFLAHILCIVVCQLYPAILERVSKLLRWTVWPHLSSGNKHIISLSTPTKPSFTQNQIACGSLTIEINLCLVLQSIIKRCIVFMKNRPLYCS